MKSNTAIVLLLLSVGLFYTFTNAQYQDVKKLHTLANEYQNVLENISAIIELREQLLVKYNNLSQAEIGRINKVLPDNVDTVRLALDLDGMASSYGIAIKNIQTSPGSGTDPNLIVLQDSAKVYDSSTLSFSFISNYTNFLNLLSDIETNLRIMDVKSITFLATDSGLYDYNVSVETYWLK